ncbi:MAG: DUF4162 domain-containing protein, partial [Planctomycetes bacterium]|nr:DUF4162 domain-containing protein [Planctomycetota bacterium]
VVDHGKVIALGSPAELIAKIGGDHFIEFRLEDTPTFPEEELRSLPSVVQLRRDEDAYVLAVTAVHLTLPALLERVEARGFKLAQLTTRHASLEDVFVTLTGRHLRDDG